MIQVTFHFFPTPKPPWARARVSCPTFLSNELQSLKHSSVSSLLPMDLSPDFSTQACTQPSLQPLLSPSLSLRPSQSSKLSLPKPSLAAPGPGATPQLGKGGRAGERRQKLGKEEPDCPQASGTTTPGRRESGQGWGWGEAVGLTGDRFRQEALLQEVQGSHSGLGQ